MPNPKQSAPSSKKPKERKRAQPGDFERQVEQIRRDITTVRNNLATAERMLDMSAPFVAPTQQQTNNQLPSPEQE